MRKIVALLAMLATPAFSQVTIGSGSANNSGTSGASGGVSVTAPIASGGTSTSNASGGLGGTSNATGGTSNATGGAGGLGGASTSNAAGGLGGASTSTNGNNQLTVTTTNTINTVDSNSRENAQITAAAKIESSRIAAEAAQNIANAPIRNTPNVSGPPLTSSYDTCMGSTSGSINVPGFGASLGNTWTDDNCIMLKNSRALHNMGFAEAAMALMCNDPKNLEALELTGYVCPQTTRARKKETITNSVPVNTNNTNNLHWLGN